MEKEKEKVQKRVSSMEEKTEKVNEGLKGVEREVVSGMKTAKEEVKKDVRNELKEQEERGSNVVVYGVDEAVEVGVKEKNEAEIKKIDELARHVGVELGEVEIKYRAGKKMEGTDAKPRPLIVKVKDDEARERLLANARRLSKVDGWKRVFVSPDMTWEQREEGKKIDKQMRDDAEKKTEEAKSEGKKGKYIVVGQRGRQRLLWITDVV